MKSKFLKFIFSWTLIFLLMMGYTQPTFASNRTYQITYAAGTLGEFKESLINDYKKLYGTKNVTVSKATGNITIKVIAKKAMPNAPTAQDITWKDKTQADQYYVLTSGWQPTTTTVSENATYVVQYGTLSKGIEYSIRYVDKTTNQDVASPIIAKANLNEVMNAYAKVIEGYTFDSQTKSITLTNDIQKNVLTFYYTAKDNTVTIDQEEEETVMRNQTVTTNQPNNNVNNNVGNNTNNDTVINDNNVPQGNGNNNETIEDEEVPLARGDELSQNNEMLYISIVGAALLFVIVAIVIKQIKRNKA